MFLSLVPKIKFSRKFPNLQYNVAVLEVYHRIMQFHQCATSLLQILIAASLIDQQRDYWRTFKAPEDLTLKVPITTAADDIFCDIFPNFRKNKV